MYAVGGGGIKAGMEPEWNSIRTRANFKLAFQQLVQDFQLLYNGYSNDNLRCLYLQAC